MFCTVNFSYPSLEEPKPPTPPPPEPEVPSEPQPAPAPAVVNGVVPAAPPTSKTSTVPDTLPDIVDSPAASSTNSELDLNKKGHVAGASSHSPASAKAFPQV